MVRISDARMSGTAFGTVILHITPDAASGGPLALVKNGDRVRLSVKHRTLDLVVSDAEMASLDITGDSFHPECNYTIKPRSP